MFAAWVAASLLATPASAATYVLNLSGTVSSGSTATVDAGGFRFNFYTITLTGFGPTTFQVGDDVQARVTLDQLLTVPSATVRNGVALVLLNTDYPGTTTGISGTTALFDAALPVMNGPADRPRAVSLSTA